MARRFKRILTAGTLAASLLCARSPPAAADPQIEWLQGQQHPTGLVDSYEGDGTPKAYTYDQALAAIAFAHAGNSQDARRILAAMRDLQNADGSWHAGYTTTGAVVSDALASGHIAWMALALNYFEAATNDTLFLPAKRKALTLLKGRMDTNPSNQTYGSIRFGASDTRVSTEHNHDAYAVFKGAAQLEGNLSRRQEYSDLSRRILDYLRTEMWAPSLTSNGRHDVNVFWTGYGDFSWCTDPQTWGVLSLGAQGPGNEPFSRSLDWLYQNPSGSTRYQMDFSPTVLNVDGFGFCTAPPNFIWIEGTEGAACAYFTANSPARGEYFHAQMDRVKSPNGGLPYSFSEVNPGSLRDMDNWRYNSVAGTAWFYFAKNTVNPFTIEGVTDVQPATWGQVKDAYRR